MADLTQGQLDEVTYISGIDQNGAVADNTWLTYNTQPYNFNPHRAYLSKWYNDANGTPIAPTSTAGTAGGTVTYAFDSTVGVQAQAAYTAALTLWSNVANVQFKQISDPTKSSVLITNTPEGGGDTYTPANGYRVPGTGATDLPTQQAPQATGGGGQVSINIGAPDDAFNKFTPNLSNLMGTIVHEAGHVVGLSHAGPYNGSDFGGQLGVYDSRLWSIMSYDNPDDPSLPYYDQYPVKGASWSVPSSDGPVGSVSQTPMMLDIIAAQRLYGASTSTTFAGGQTYGFNSNIADASKEFYDFSVNQHPIVTIYNTGTNNTLDLSGFSSGSTIDLNPGTFSSASASGQLFKNIGIAYGTRIDKAIGGAGNDYFTLNGNGDTIDGRGGYNIVNVQGAASDYTVDNIGSTNMTLTNNKTGVTDTLTNIQKIQFEAPVCFTTGTGIRVLRNGVAIDVPVEALRVSDVAVTAEGRLRSIVWIGSRSLDGNGHALDRARQPVRVRAGAFGSGLPERDLRLSPGHPVLVGADADSRGGVLVPIMCLINGTSIVRDAVGRITYWHVELDAHDILLAEGVPAESYLDGGDRPFFVEASDHALHNPDFIPPGLAGRCRPVVVDGPLVEAERRRIDTLFAADLVAQCGWGADCYA